MNSSVKNLSMPSIMAGNNCDSVNVFNVFLHTFVVTDVLLGLISNAGVVWLLLNRRGGCVTSDILVFNLAFSELIICPSIFFSFLHHINLEIPFFMPALNFAFEFFQVGRPLFRCCICMDRYLAVVHPFVFLKFKQLKHKLELLAFVWFIALLMCTMNTLYQVLFMNIAVFLPVLAIDSFCSISILRVLRRPRPGEGEQEEGNLMKRRAFRTVLVFQVMMMLNYIPMIAISFAILKNPYYQCQLFPVAFTFLVLGSPVDPFFFFSRLGKVPCAKTA